MIPSSRGSKSLKSLVQGLPHLKDAGRHRLNVVFPTGAKKEKRLTLKAKFSFGFWNLLTVLTWPGWISQRVRTRLISSR